MENITMTEPELVNKLLVDFAVIKENLETVKVMTSDMKTSIKEMNKKVTEINEDVIILKTVAGDALEVKKEVAKNTTARKIGIWVAGLLTSGTLGIAIKLIVT